MEGCLSSMLTWTWPVEAFWWEKTKIDLRALLFGATREAKASQSVLGQQLLEKRCDGRGAAKKEKSQFADCSVNNQNKPDGGEAANCKSPRNVEMQ